MLSFARRNLKIFFRDKTSVFFSLLSCFIILGLYILFLGDTYAEGMKDLLDKDTTKLLVGVWTMAGLIAVTAVTTALGSLEPMVNDRSTKVLKDFSASPIKRSSLTGGYLISTFMVAIIMTTMVFIATQLYLFSLGLEPYALGVYLKLLALIILAVIAGASMVVFIVSFFSSQSAFGVVSTIVGTLIGFVTGIYIPIGSLPSGVQTVVKLFPISHVALLFKQVMMGDLINSSFANAPAEASQEFSNVMGMSFSFGGKEFTELASVLLVLGYSAVFLIIAWFNLSKKRK